LSIVYCIGQESFDRQASRPLARFNIGWIRDGDIVRERDIEKQNSGYAGGRPVC
jgi:hypothetical protein